MDCELVVAICTFNRPEGLRVLLTALLRQSKSLGAKSVILVVDNSTDGNAGWINSYPEFGQQVEYLHVNHGGLSNARNAALRYARKLGAALAFIDDDEVPHENWLSAAHSVVLFPNNEILAGPVVPDFGPNTSVIGIPIKYWERPKRGNGALVEGFVGDGNIVYPGSLVLSGLEYSLEFSFSGGQDTDFLLRAKKMGYMIRNLESLSVTERVPVIRQSLSYLVDRSFHSSSSWAAVNIANGEPRLRLFLSIVKRSILAGTNGITWLLTHSHEKKIKSSIHAASVKGSIFALRGNQINRYQSYQSEKDR